MPPLPISSPVLGVEWGYLLDSFFSIFIKRRKTFSLAALDEFSSVLLVILPSILLSFHPSFLPFFLPSFLLSFHPFFCPFIHRSTLPSFHPFLAVLICFPLWKPLERWFSRWNGLCSACLCLQDGLIQQCGETMKETINVKTVCGYYTSAGTYGLDSVKKKWVTFPFPVPLLGI